MGPKSPRINIPGYHFLKKDRPNSGDGGLAFAIHESVPFTPLSTDFITDPHLKSQAITVTINNSPLILFNTYLPPASSCGADHVLSPDTLNSIFRHSEEDTLILGDWNAHHAA